MKLRSVAAAVSLSAACANAAPVLSPYKDITLYQYFGDFVMRTDVNGSIEPVLPAKKGGRSQLLPGNKSLIWSFASGECGHETWASYQAQSIANANIPRFTANNIDYIISTGGASAVFFCSTVEGMRAFVNRYESANFAGLDFDIEGGYTATTIDSLIKTTATVQKEYKTKKKKLPVTLTMSTGGSTRTYENALNEFGLDSLKAAKKYDLDYTVNLLAYDFGGDCTFKAAGQCDMGQSAINAARSLHNVHKIPYNRIILTTMIGANDQATLITSTEDVRTIVKFARHNELAGVRYWSFDRDRSCNEGENASPTCSGVVQSPLEYDQVFIEALSTTRPSSEL